MTKEQKQRIASIAEELRTRLDRLTDVQSQVSDDDEDYETLEEAYQSLRDACDSLEGVGR